jgi:hypothetical protein
MSRIMVAWIKYEPSHCTRHLIAVTNAHEPSDAVSSRQAELAELTVVQLSHSQSPVLRSGTWGQWAALVDERPIAVPAGPSGVPIPHIRVTCGSSFYMPRRCWAVSV